MISCWTSLAFRAGRSFVALGSPPRKPWATSASPTMAVAAPAVLGLLSNGTIASRFIAPATSVRKNARLAPSMTAAPVGTVSFR